MVVTDYVARLDTGGAEDANWKQKALVTYETNKSKRRKDAKLQRRAVRHMAVAALVANRTQKDFAAVANEVLPLGLRKHLFSMQERYRSQADPERSSTRPFLQTPVGRPL